MLQLDGLTKRFGGLVAVDGVTLTIPPGRITGLIGPNGAGKTTIFNLITGLLRPDAGQVRLDGADVTGLRPHAIARRGIGRTFQHTRVFLQLSVLQNAMLGLPQVSDGLLDVLRVGRATWRRWADQVAGHLAFVGLAADAERPAAALGQAEQKLLMLACVLASGARTLLLDEPTAGIDPAARRRVLEAVLRLRDIGKTVVLIEHNLDVVRGSCDAVVFLAEGRVLAEGSAAEIEADARLTRLYFGGGAHA